MVDYNKLIVLKNARGGMAQALSVMTEIEIMKGAMYDLVLPSNCVGGRQLEALQHLESYGLVEYCEEEIDPELDERRGWFAFTKEGRELLRAVMAA